MDTAPTCELHSVTRRTLLLIASAFGLFGVVFGTWLELDETISTLSEKAVNFTLCLTLFRNYGIVRLSHPVVLLR